MRVPKILTTCLVLLFSLLLELSLFICLFSITGIFLCSFIILLLLFIINLLILIVGVMTYDSRLPP